MSEAVIVHRDYPVLPERVYEAWTRVDLLTQWFGCGPGMLWNVHEWDVRIGGAIHVSLDFGSGPFEVKGEFVVVDPPRRLGYLWSTGQTVDVTIEPHGQGSRLTVEHHGLATDQECAITNNGWTSALDQLRGVTGY